MMYIFIPPQPSLLLTSCEANEFTCADGHCIPKSKRCDLSLDCSDQSDERECNRVAVPEGYSNKLPPPNIKGDPVPLYTLYVVRTIKSLDLPTFRVAIDISVEIKYLDTRLMYRNLQDDRRSNKLDNWEDVWTPSLKIVDGTQGLIDSTVHNKGVFVFREDKPLRDDDSTIYEDNMYSGSTNMLMFQEEQTIEFSCHFDLVMYPFDQQECYLNVEIHDYDLRLGYFVKDENGTKYLGNRHLLEYNLLWLHYQPYLDHNASHAGLELRFRNQFRYYIGNIFLPSLMLVILCYVTLFFDLNDFNDRIMVSLTSLLVLVTFFTDTSQAIPKTAYFKLIDVWFMSLMFEDFFIILSIIYIEEQRQELARPTSSPSSSFSASQGSFIKNVLRPHRPTVTYLHPDTLEPIGEQDRF
ncbi:Gamma-aminobutyric acid receptor subunit theta [Penaeus vannamei]|uniref:Gamma-aminobutyric acid receptor subunit theta n=1 Tax=Penaeus vannamei TaxID=6689 RepID=A0A3R7SXY8_PENVA|nr:Gamma-aminobutyric acid receptor subunit theta [Penaeus vannamei]